MKHEDFCLQISRDYCYVLYQPPSAPHLLLATIRQGQTYNSLNRSTMIGLQLKSLIPFYMINFDSLVCHAWHFHLAQTEPTSSISLLAECFFTKCVGLPNSFPATYLYNTYVLMLIEFQFLYNITYLPVTNRTCLFCHLLQILLIKCITNNTRRRNSADCQDKITTGERLSYVSKHKVSNPANTYSNSAGLRGSSLSLTPLHRTLYSAVADS